MEGPAWFQWDIIEETKFIEVEGTREKQKAAHPLGETPGGTRLSLTHFSSPNTLETNLLFSPGGLLMGFPLELVLSSCAPGFEPPAFPDETF